jgi:tetratricopeptide (TPR) repeat protein
MPVNASPTDLAWWLHKLRAMGWLLLGRHGRARTVFDTMLRRWPGDAYALASRAHLSAQGGDRPAAVADLQALLAAHPQAGAAHWFNLAFLLEALDRLDDAEAAFRQAVALDPKLDRAWYGLGLTLLRLGRHDDAVVALKRNTELQPMSPYGWVQLARVHMKRHDPQAAVKVIRHLKGFEPQVAEQLQRETGLQV